MKKCILVLAVCCIVFPVWGADENLPPLPGMEDLQSMPLPGMVTPVPSPAPISINSNALSPKLETQVTPALNEIRVLPTVTPVQAVPSDTPAAEPVQNPAIVITPSETFTIKAMPKGITVFSKGAKKVTGGGALTEYFPITQDAQWSYEYLKPIEGSTDKKAFTVKCLSAKKMANGTIRVVLETTKDDKSWRERYSLYNGIVEHTGTEDQAYHGDYVFKLPKAGGTTSWKREVGDGSIQYYKVNYGPTEVNGKGYSDCLVVTEKVMKGKQVTFNILSYYAKGVGLVSVQFYSSDMKLFPEKSIALSQP